MKIVQIKNMKEYSAKFRTELMLSENGTAEKKYSGLPLNIESSENGIIISSEGFEQKFLSEEISSIFDTGKSLILNTESGQIYSFSEAGGSKGIKIIKAANAPKDAASRADQRKKALAQGYSGVRYENEEGYDLEEDGKGIKVLPASSAPKDPEDRAKKRKQWLDQGYDGVRWENEDASGGKSGEDLVETVENDLEKEFSSLFIRYSKLDYISFTKAFGVAMKNQLADEDELPASFIGKLQIAFAHALK